MKEIWKKIRYASAVCACVLCAAAAVTACKKEPMPQPQPAEYFFAFLQEEIALTEGESRAVGYVLYQGDDPVENADIAWQSEDSGIATVAGNVLTAVAAGETYVTARFAEQTQRAKVMVTARPAVSYVVRLTESERYLYPEERATLTATVTADGAATEINPTFTSSDENVVTVSATGALTPIGLGTAVVTAAYGGSSAVCTVHVENRAVVAVSIAAVKLAVGDTKALDVSVTEDGGVGDATAVRYESRDTAVVAVEGGRLVGKSAGKAVVDVKYGSAEAGVTVEVFDYVIRTPAEFMAINDDLTASYYLENDVDMTGVTYITPAHYSDSQNGKVGFAGRLDGNGKTVRNLDLSYTGKYSNSNALIGLIVQSGVVENLNVQVGGRGIAYSGGICNVNYGTIRNCCVTVGTVQSADNASYAFGGIANQNQRTGLIENCIVDFSEATVSGNIAGLVGRTYNGARYRNCFCVTGTHTGIEPIFNRNNTTPDLSTVYTVTDAAAIYDHDLRTFDGWTLDYTNKTLPTIKQI